MENDRNYLFEYGDSKHLSLDNPHGVFAPTGTTKALVNAAAKYLKHSMKMLDLGCGCGAVGIALQQLGLVEGCLYASDISPEAVQVTRSNAAKHNCDIMVREGSVFEPWEDEVFDCILNDVSGVAAQAAAVSPWFDSVPCAAGVDGTDLITQVLETAPKFMKPDGLLFFPVISLSNTEKIIEVAKSNFQRLDRLSRDEWPLPSVMVQHSEMLQELESKKLIKLNRRFGMTLFYTEIYIVSKFV